jgi:hypothetical protein
MLQSELVGENEVPARASAALLAALQGDSERVTVREILDALDARAFGLMTLLFALPSCVPMPPGVPTVVGVALMMVSLQMVAGRRELWLPRFICQKSFSRASLVSAVSKMRPFLEGLERVARPRLSGVTGRLGARLIGAVILFMAIILILPLPPGGNFPPALAAAVLGMGLAERDGVIVLLGAAVSIAAVVLSYAVTALFLRWLASVIMG